MARLIRSVFTALNRRFSPQTAREVNVQFGPARGLRLHVEPPFKTQRWLGMEEIEIGPTFARWMPLAGAVVDIGANDGYYTTWAAARNPKALVVACEAESSFRPLCERGLVLNELAFGERIRWVNGFAGTAGVTLDSLCAGLPEPLLIKIDVEGAEVDVLRSGLRTLREKNCKLIVEVHSGSLEAETSELLRSLGYRVEIFPTAWWRAILPETRTAAHNQWLTAERVAPEPSRS
jgi:hypothetical protein